MQEQRSPRGMGAYGAQMAGSPGNISNCKKCERPMMRGSMPRGYLYKPHRSRKRLVKGTLVLRQYGHQWQFHRHICSRADANLSIGCDRRARPAQCSDRNGYRINSTTSLAVNKNSDDRCKPLEIWPVEYDKISTNVIYILTNLFLGSATTKYKVIMEQWKHLTRT